MSLTQLDTVLSRDGFVIFICGPKEKGKTNVSLLLSEYCYLKQFRTKIATNIKTESYIIERQITNYPDLQDWMQTSGRKLFVLDEGGKILKKMRFMSDINQKLMDIIQLIRHYDAGFICCAPSEKLIDSLFLNTDILDLKIRKITQTRAHIWDYLNNQSYFLEDIPETSISYNSKDLAIFTKDKKPILNEMPICCQVAASYSSGRNMTQIGEAFDLEREQVKRLIREHIAHSLVTSNVHSEGKQNHKEPLLETKSP